MKTRKSKPLLGILPYILSLMAITAIIVFGSLRHSTTVNGLPILSALNEANFVVSTDQFSESFVVASVSRSTNLPSAAVSGENYASILVSYKLGQISSSPSLDKPNIIDTSNLNRDVITYTVQGGDTLDSIAKHFGISNTDITWSNNMKTTAVTPGQVLYLPPRPGILYTVRGGDTLQSLAEKYKSNAEEIEIYNDLEKTGLVVGSTILLPSGVLPEKERPDYKPPVVTPAPTYISNVNSRNRQNLRIIDSHFYVNSPGNPGSRGQCTWFAWWWRSNLGWGYQLPSGHIGNAGTWTSPFNPARIPNIFYIDHDPRVNDVVQTSTGSPGHVGIVTAVVPGEYITIREMNFVRAFVVSEAEVPWAIAKTYNYIHQRK